MGFIRFHRQLRFGIFKVNFSKTGIGYGIGWRGFNLTKMPNGKVRMTNSIPGSGFSYINEFGSKNDKNRYGKIINEYKHYFSDTTGNHVEVVSESKKILFLEIMNYIDKDKKYNKFTFIMFLINLYGGFYIKNFRLANALTINIIFITLFIISLIFNINHKISDRVRVDYTFDDKDGYINDFNEAAWRVKNNIKIWRADNKSFVDEKERSAAIYTINTTNVSIDCLTPYFIDSNYVPYHLKAKKDNYYLFPDCIIIVNNKKISIIDYQELEFDISKGSLQLLNAPTDSFVKSYTWECVNKDGTPDRRFKVNNKLNVIVPGIVNIVSKNGFNICLYFSSIFQAMKLQEKIINMINKYKDLKVKDLEDEII